MDYFTILDLAREPFSNSPDPGFFFRSRQHAECLHQLEIAIRLRRGLNVVIGEIGSGKTTLCRQLIRSLGEGQGVETHLLLDPSFSSPREFLLALCTLLTGGSPEPSLTDWQIKETIKNRLLRSGVEESGLVTLIIDEGQKILPSCLEILRELLNFETNQAKLLQIVIFAQKEFQETLVAQPNLADRINFRYELRALDFRDTRRLIEFRIKESAAGYKSPRLFTLGGYLAVSLATGGYPRKIINLCHRVLLGLIVQNRAKASWSMVWAVAGKAGDGRSPLLRWAPAAILLLLLGTLALPLAMEIPGGRGFRVDGAVPASESSSSNRDGALLSETPASTSITDQSGPEPLLPRAEAVRIPESPSEQPLSPGKSWSFRFVPEPAPQDAPYPRTLGSVPLARSEILSELIHACYGVYNPAYLQTVARSNPHLKDMHALDAGSRVIFPAIPLKNGQGVRRVWIVAGMDDSLEHGFETWRALRGTPAKVRILPFWTDQEGIRFALVLERGYADLGEAERDLPKRSRDLPDHELTVREWSEDTVFFSILPVFAPLQEQSASVRKTADPEHAASGHAAQRGTL
jgi:general secretion pathway protein A